MCPSGLTMTPDPKLRSRCSRGIRNSREKSSPKNCWKNGSEKNGACGPLLGERMIFDDAILTTAGSAFLTTGTKPLTNETCFATSPPAAVEIHIGTASATPKGALPVFAVTQEPVRPPTSRAKATATITKLLRGLTKFVDMDCLHEGLEWPSFCLYWATSIVEKW